MEAEVEVDKMQPVSNNNNAEMFLNTLEEQSVGVHQTKENAEELSLDVSEFMDTVFKVIEAELEKCRDQKLGLCTKIARALLRHRPSRPGPKASHKWGPPTFLCTSI